MVRTAFEKYYGRFARNLLACDLLPKTHLDLTVINRKNPEILK